MELKKYVIECKKCGKQFEIECTENNYQKGKYKKYCSRSCANSHIVTQETKDKISTSLKNSIKFKEDQEGRFSNQKLVKCKFCCKEYTEYGLKYHMMYCKENPNRYNSICNNGNKPVYISKQFTDKVKMRNGDILDITKYELEKYREEHKTCEICGRTIDDCVKWKSKSAPKHLCIDHNHETLKFRGLLCSVCNRQLGWYENNKEKIEQYLNKNI